MSFEVGRGTMVGSAEYLAGHGDGPDVIILETKLTRPRTRSEHIPRLGLLAALRSTGAKRLTLVAAPAGFGKTTLLAEWAAEEVGHSVAWVSLDEDDNDPARFFTYVAAALKTVEPQLGGRALAALQAPGADLFEVVLPLFLNDLAGLGRELVLVLDDYHLINSQPVHDAVAYLLNHLPDTVRIVLATREDPPLPLGRLRAGGDLAEFRVGELRFTDQETANFLVDALGLELSAGDVGQLQARTEGWPAALYLAALSLRGQPNPGAAIDDFAGDDRYLVDYLTTEVLARQSPELRSFLLQTSILKRFCGSLCDAVAGRVGSSALLADLEKSNLLLVPLDSRRQWYRYHHLFGELLNYELRATDRASLPELHRRASEWYRDAGFIVDAAAHAIAAGDTEAAVDLIALHYVDFVDKGQLATVLRWLEALPREATDDWLLGFVAGVVSAHAGRFEEAERWLERAMAAPPRLRNGQGPAGPLAALKGYLRLLRGDISGAITSSRQALAESAAADPAWALGPQMVLAPSLWWGGELGAAKTILESVSRTAEATDSPATMVYALGLRAAIELDEQDEAGAEALASEAMEIMNRAGLAEHPWSVTAHIVQGTVLRRRGDLVGAAEEVERGMALAQGIRAWQTITHASLALAEVRHGQHQPAAARRLLASARDVLQSLPDPGDARDRLERTEKVLRVRATRDRTAASAPFWELSPRELEVLRLLPSRLSQREIAAELYVSFNTIRTHTRVIFNKLGVASRSEAVARARELGLI